MYYDEEPKKKRKRKAEKTKKVQQKQRKEKDNSYDDFWKDEDGEWKDEQKDNDDDEDYDPGHVEVKYEPGSDEENAPLMAMKKPRWAHPFEIRRTSVRVPGKLTADDNETSRVSKGPAESVQK